MKFGALSRIVPILFIALAVAKQSSPSDASANTAFTIDARVPASLPETGYLQMGSPDAGKSPSGHVLSLNSRYLTLDGKPWLPVMGEFHYSRYPERYWEEEILKMKAGGIQIVATYVFWIHHEEVEDQFDWSGQRDLRRFVDLCAKHGLYVYPRIGPWAHGEVRNGGFPDWLIKKGPTRLNDPGYLFYVHRYYGEVARQLKGLLWKQGGRVIGIQLENEYSNRSPDGGAAYISKLKSMAIDAGLDVPLYTVTGWDNAVYPAREVVPVFGGYPDEPWSNSVQELPPDVEGVYQFHTLPTSAPTGILQGVSGAADDVQLWHYPRITAELGGGVQLTYHRRVVVNAHDIPPMALTALGSGVNLLGYYMFQGGTNPQGKLSTLQESQATGYPNDVPVKSYDFQAPLRQYGQMNASFRELKVIHQFVRDFGSELALMTANLPDVVPGPHDTTTLRISARTAGNRGFLFFNNYLRNHPLPEHAGVRVVLRLPTETVTVPADPVNIPSQSSFIWPVNMDVGGALLEYSTAQPFAKMNVGKVSYYFFVSSMGIDPEFAFVGPTIAKLESHGGRLVRREGRVYVTAVAPSTEAAIDLQTQAGARVRIVLLSPEQAQNSWKILLHGQEHLLITPADLFADGENIHLRSRDTAFTLSVLPDFESRPFSSPQLQKSGVDGLFARYRISMKPKRIQVGIRKVRDAASSSPVQMGKTFDWRPVPVAAAPGDSEFNTAGISRLTFPEDAWKGISDLFLDITYVGDVARLYAGSTLLDDNFYNGTAWEIGLKRLWPSLHEKELDLQILPLRKDAPIYIPRTSWPDFGSRSEVGAVESVIVSPEYEVVVSAGKSH